MAATLANGAWVPFAFVAGFFVLVAVAIIGGVIANKKRREALEAVADEMGFAFDKDAAAAGPTVGSGMKLFSRGRSRKATNAMSTRIEDVDVVVFHYRYTTGGGKNSSTHRQTVVSLAAPGLNLPNFACEPEHFFHRLGEMLGFKDIDFDDHPEFSKKTRLTGDDEEAIRRLFGPELIGYFEAHPKLTVEGRGNRVIAYHAGRTQKVAGYRRFAEDAMELVVLLS